MPATLYNYQILYLAALVPLPLNNFAQPQCCCYWIRLLKYTILGSHPREYLHNKQQYFVAGKPLKLAELKHELRLLKYFACPSKN